VKDASLVEAIQALVADLAHGKFAEVETDGRAGRLGADVLQHAVREYGRVLLPLPVQGLALIDVVPVRGNPSELSVDVPMWSVEEGRSDLTLQLEATKVGGTWQLAIMNLHVL
jgi:hypothetical protein